MLSDVLDLIKLRIDNDRTIVGTKNEVRKRRNNEIDKGNWML